MIVVEGHTDQWNRRENPGIDSQIHPTDFLQRYNQFNRGKMLPFQQRVREQQKPETTSCPSKDKWLKEP